MTGFPLGGSDPSAFLLEVMAFTMPDIREKMLSVGSEPMPGSPEELSKRYADWITIFTKVAKEAGLTPK